MYGRPSCSPTSKIVTVLGARESRATASASRVKRSRTESSFAKRVRQQLDRDGALELRVLGAVDLAHAAVGDPLRTAVAGWEWAGVHGDGLPVLPWRKTAA